MTPFVSIIVPCYNEQATIRLLLESIYRQDYPRDDMEVVIADGRSTDRTIQEIADFQRDFADLKVTVVENTRRVIPAGLNRALEAVSGEVIVRLDAHSMPASDYVRRCVDGLQAKLGDNIGGIWDIRPGKGGWAARSIAAAAAHPFGVGDARYRLASSPGAVDTVPFGAFHRTLIERIGAFDETLLTNEDYEFNVRVRKNGGRVWLDPQIRSVYFARNSFSDLARQYWRYGFWKQRMLRRYPETLRWRQALPPVFVLSLVILSILALFWMPARFLLAVEVLFYLLVLLAGSVPTAIRNKDAAMLVGIPIAIIIMHISWGAGFLWSANNS
jgi:glycosyltransferase involved in cell wall biosynthesis